MDDRLWKSTRLTQTERKHLLKEQHMKVKKNVQSIE